MHKVLLDFCRSLTLEKMIKNKNRNFKFAHNLKIQNYHKLYGKKHIVSKGLEEIYSRLAPIYQELDTDFQKTDLIDLEFYERWLNG